MKAAGAVLPPSMPLTGPASPRRSVCAPGMMDFHGVANHLPAIEKKLLNLIR
jgi:hypothetical protein